MALAQYLLTLLSWLFADRTLRDSAQAAENAWHQYLDLCGPNGLRRRMLYWAELPRTYQRLAALQIDPERKAEIQREIDTWYAVESDPYAVDDNVRLGHVTY